MAHFAANANLPVKVSDPWLASLVEAMQLQTRISSTPAGAEDRRRLMAQLSRSARTMPRRRPPIPRSPQLSAASA